MKQSPEPRCAKCGTRLDRAGEDGLCAVCAFRLALDVPPGTDGDPGGVPVPPDIPGYEIRELLGQGGMGLVWRAEQRKPVRREVAIKVVRAGFDSDEVAARFEAEGQALALMDHPHLARLFDAGRTADGRPFFAMEYVPGLPITRFCNARRLTVDERVALFAKVCDTVHHAHQKGILHRDLKPSNILVLDREGVPEPKVIDFGIAKATRPRILDHTAITRMDQLLGTPEYMSPEQLGGEVDVDVRSDVYALGAVLYELLTDTSPLDVDRLSEAGPGEVLRHIREVDSPTPSQRVTAMTPEAVSARRARPASLASKLRGDLDWITMKALAKERERRYDSARRLADDQRRYLRHEPVEAGPPGVRYRLRKFIRRRPAAVAVVSVILASLLVLGVSRSLQADRLAHENARANREAEVARQTTRFLVELFRTADPGESPGEDVTARELLDRGAVRIRGEVEDPAVRATLMGEMGVVYRDLGRPEEAQEMLQEAALLHRDAFGPDDPRTLGVLDELAGVHAWRGDAAAADSLFTAVLDGWLRVTDDRDPRYLNALHNRADFLRRRDRVPEAEAAFRHVLEVRRARGEEDEPGALAAMSNLARLLKDDGRFAESESLFTEAHERRRRVLGADHPRTLGTLGSLGGLYSAMGDYGRADSVLRSVAEAKQRVLGETHASTLATLEEMAHLHWRQGDWERAAEDFAAILQVARKTLGQEHPHTLKLMHNLAGALDALDRRDEAERLARETLALRERVLGENHSQTLATLYTLALIAAKNGDRETALSRLRTLVDRGFAHPQILRSESFQGFAGDPEFDPLFDEIRRRLATN